ncbi:MAG: right-handed parallel beta-helix repeat-containing protein [Kiritimatiellia bacterium]|jgi:hypothetical protein
MKIRPFLATLSACALIAGPAAAAPVASGLKVWVAADQIPGAQEGAAVSTWPDLSGNGSDFTVQDGTAPTYSSTGLNGRPTVRFTGDLLRCATSVEAPYTIFVVARMHGTMNGRLISSSRNWLLGYHGGGWRGMYAEGWVKNSEGNIPTTPDIWTAHGDFTYTAFYDNGTLLARNANGVYGPAQLALGGWWNLTELSDGDVSEVLLYDRVLTDVEQAKVGSYLQRKYGIAGAYSTFEVANPVNGNACFTATNAVVVSDFPVVSGATEYQITVGEHSAPAEDAWAAYVSSTIPDGLIDFEAENGDTVTFVAWFRSTGAGAETNDFPYSIAYVTTPPAAVARDISVMAGADGTRTIVADEVDGGSSDATGIASKSVAPSTLGIGTTQVTLAIVNNAGATATATADVTVTPYVAPGESGPASVSFPLPQGYLTHLLHLGADFHNDYINTSVGGVGDIGADQLAAFGGQTAQRPVGGLVYEDVPGATTANGDLVWTEMECPRADGLWTPEPDRSNYIKYWHVYIFVPGTEDRPVVFRHYNDDGFRLWNNGTLMASHGGAGGEYAAAGTLYAGLNSITLKLQEGGGGDYMRLRITDPSGAYYDDLAYQLVSYLFQVADPVTGNTDYTGSTLLDVVSFPDFPRGTDYQVTLSTNASSLSSAWTFLDVDNPPRSLAAPFTAEGPQSVVLWTRSFAQGGGYETNSISYDIHYTRTAPVALAKDATLDINATDGTAIDPAWIDNGSYDDVSGILSLTVDPPVVHGACTVELVVSNNVGLVDRATAAITVNSWLDAHVAPDGDDTTGTGRPDAPWRTFTHALSQTAQGGTVYAAPGLYDPAAGEVFPLDANGYTIRCTQAGTDYAVLDATNGADNLFLFANGGSAHFAGLWLRETTGAVFRVEGTAYGSEADIRAEDCLFTQSREDYFWTFDNQPDGRAFCVSALGVFDAFSPAIGTFDRCVFTNINRYALFQPTVGRSIFTLNDCVVVSNRVLRGVFSSYGAGNICSQQLYFNRTDFIGNRCLFLDTWYSNGYVHDCAEASVAYLAGNAQSGDPRYTSTMVADRTRFLGNQGGNLIGFDYCAPNVPKFTSCLFADNYAHQAMFQGHAAYPDFANCTFTRNSGGYAAGPANDLVTTFYNCIFHSDGAMSFTRNIASFPNKIILHDCILWNTPDGDGWGVAASSNVMQEDPILENVAVAYDDPAFNPRPRPYSPALDAGVNASLDVEARPLDLDSNARLADNDGDGVATLDLGCYESLFGATVVPTFQVPAPGAIYAIRGTAMTVPVSISPAAPGPVTASIAYPDCVTGPATLAFQDGAGPVDLTVTILPDSTNDWARAVLADSADPAGVTPYSLDFILSDPVVNAGHAQTVYLRTGDVFSIPVSIDCEGVVAPADIAVGLDSTSGTGSNQMAWQGPDTIAEGEAVSGGSLVITAGSGVNVATLSVGDGYVFAETGGDTVDITLVGYPDWMAVDPANGDDSRYIGTMDAPFRTVTRALSVMRDSGEVRLFPGDYTPAQETFPWTPGNIALVGYTAAGAVDAGFAGRTVTGSDAVTTLVKYDGVRNAVTNAAIANLAFRDTSNASVWIDGGSLALRHCDFTQTTANHNAGGGIVLRDNAQVSAEDCSFHDMTRLAAVLESANALNNNSVFTGTRCSFVRNNSAYGALAADNAMNSGRAALYDCEFAGNGVANGDRISELFRSPAIYLRMGSLRIERCRFLGNTGGQLIGATYYTAYVRDSLFAGNSNTNGIFRGYGQNMDVRNCTFVGNLGGYNTMNCNTTFYNCILRDGTLSMMPSDDWMDYCPIRINNSILWDMDEGLPFRYWTGSEHIWLDVDDYASNLMRVDPQLKRVDVAWDDPSFNAHPGGTSPARDAGNNAAVDTLFDLDGAPRIAYGTVANQSAGGDAIVDLGCYESDPVPSGTILLIR